MEAFFDLLPEIPTDGQLWHAVNELAWKLDRKGCVAPLTDIAIACCAQRAGATLISTDAQFPANARIESPKRVHDKNLLKAFCAFFSRFSIYVSRY
jgi:hypothetical protein